MKVEEFNLDKNPAAGKLPSGIFHLQLHRKITPEDIMSDLKARSFVTDIYEV